MRKNRAPPTQWRRWGRTEHRLLSGVDEEEPSTMMEVKPDEVKLWLVVVTWLPLQRSRYYNCLPFRTRAPLSVESVWRRTSKGTWNGNLEWKPWMGTLSGNPMKNLPTQMMGDRGGKPGDQWEHPSPVGKLMSLKGGLCRWWKTSQPSYGRLRRKTGQGINW